MLSEQTQRCQLFTTSDDPSAADKMRQSVMADSLLIAAIASSQEGNESKEDGKHISKTPANQIDNLVMDFANKLEAICLDDTASGEETSQKLIDGLRLVEPHFLLVLVCCSCRTRSINISGPSAVVSAVICRGSISSRGRSF